jgi:hypothetical protein
MLGFFRSVSCGALLAALTTSAHAGPEMFQASFVLHAFGNDITSGSLPPYASNDWTALPLGHDCEDAYPYTANGATAPHYCDPATRQAGQPAAGSGTLVPGTGSPASIAVPQSALGITTVGALPLRSGYLQSDTYATFVNGSGAFFAGGGPGSILRYYGCGPGPTLCPLVIHNGPNRFGGAMPLLGRLGGAVKWVASEVSGTFVATSSWNMILALGRNVLGDPMNPYTNTGMFYNEVMSWTFTTWKYAKGTRWTTGQVGAFATTNAYYTVLYRTGYDNRTADGLGRIQLVTPALTRWTSGGWSENTGHIGILTIQVPEVHGLLLLTAGIGALLGLRRIGRRC